MRSAIIILLLVIFTGSWLKPYYPYLDYVINKEYIVENLCENIEKPELQCDGKCHLAKEIKKITEEEEKGPSNPFSQHKTGVKLSLFVHYFDLDYFIADFIEEINHVSRTLAHILDVSSDIPTPPPRHYNS